MLARTGVDLDTIPRNLLPDEPISCRSIVIRAVDGVVSPFRLTGANIPPPPTLKMSETKLESLVKDNQWDTQEGEALNHVICGDLNPTSWYEMFGTWMMEAGFWYLSDPHAPTSPTGSCLDRFIIKNGCQAFGSLFGGEGDQDDDEDWAQLARHVYPAKVSGQHPPDIA